ncbi:hypothetical protein BFG60_1981 [Microcystis aeruginosa NIES-98]|nr:hypothetical protein BFG60_1981 [Microcystis aeruginosa NIES-98]
MVFQLANIQSQIDRETTNALDHLLPKQRNCNKEFSDWLYDYHR